VSDDGQRAVGRNAEVTRTLLRLEGAWRRVAEEETLESLCAGPESKIHDPEA
jgi:hypothetical protein